MDADRLPRKFLSVSVPGQKRREAKQFKTQGRSFSKIPEDVGLVMGDWGGLAFDRSQWRAAWRSVGVGDAAVGS